MRTYQDFHITLLRFSSDYTLKMETPENRKELAEALHNQLWNLDGPRQIESKITSRDKFFTLVFSGFNEITKSYLCLRDIEIYIRRFPYGDTDISRSRHLEYHIANYFQEIYILKNRLVTYAKRVKRAYRKSQDVIKINKVIDEIKNVVEQAFESITMVRGVHVHESRYSDDALERIQTWELLSKYQDENTRFYEFLYGRNYKEVRRDWAVRVKNNNRSISDVFDLYFGSLYSLLFDDKGKLKFPN